MDGPDLEPVLRNAGLLGAGQCAIERLSGGHSHVTSVVREDGAPVYVVKVAQHDGPLAPYDVAQEVLFMQLAATNDLPSPEVVHVSQENALGTQLFVMRYVEGHAPTPSQVVGWLADHPSITAPDLTEEVVRTLVAMAAIEDPSEDSPGGLGLVDHYRRYADGCFASLNGELEGVMPVPATIRLVHERLLEGAELLGEHPRSLVHGDFRFGNLMIDDTGRINAILDWERGMWGHPLHDLAYLSLPSMGHRGRVAGLVTDEELLATWKRVAGEEVDLTALSYLRTVSIFSELCSCVRALGAYSHGRGRTSLLRILPIIARHEVDVLDSLNAWSHDGRAA